jgi:predicted transcriptional regulator of viral defense system
MSVSAVEALGSLLRMGKPVVTTEDAALRLGLKLPAATRALGRLAAAGLVLRLRHGLWSLDPRIDPLSLPAYLTAPFPAYVSLQSALHLHGMLSQVPQLTYVASLASTRRLKTQLGEYSIHRLAPSFFGGFDVVGGGVLLATPEKALLDTLYLTPARSRLFAALPEVEIPRSFDRKQARHWLEKIALGPRRTAVERRLDALLRRAGSARREFPNP